MEFLTSLNIVHFLPELILAFGSILFLMFDVFLPQTSKDLVFLNFKINLNVSSFIFILIILLNSIIILYFIPVENVLVLNGHFINNIFICFMKLLLNVFLIVFVLICNGDFKHGRISTNEFLVLITLSVLGMYLTISSYDFILLYLSIELQSLCFYVMASYRTNSISSTEAGLKYFVLGAVSSAVLLFGISLIYGFTGITSFFELSNYFVFKSHDFSSESSIIIGIIFVVAAIIFKLGGAPFHFWLPDVYEGAKSIVTAYFAIITKISILVVFINLLYGAFYNFFVFWHYFLIFSGILSLIVGTIGALYQTDLKRFIAFSGISHMGFMLLAICVGNLNGIVACIYYLIIYLILSLNFFSVIVGLHNIKKIFLVRELGDLYLLPKFNAFIASCFAINLFSFAGIPPLAGFFGKFLVIKCLFDAELFFVGSIALFISVIGAIYYFKLIHVMYFQKTEVEYDVEKLNFLDSVLCFVVMGMTTFLNLFFWMFTPNLNNMLISFFQLIFM